MGPLELHNQEFHRAFRGYNRKEVDAYMRKVIESYEILVRKEKWTLEQGVPVTPGGGQTVANPLDIYNQEFKRMLWGYDVDEVNDFLDWVIQSIERLVREKEA